MLKFSQFWMSYIFLIYTIGYIRCQDPRYGSHFEGDIILTKEQKNLLKLKTLTEIGITPWNRGIVPYTFAPGQFTNSEKRAIETSMRTLENQVRKSQKRCIQFVRRRSQRDFVEIIKGNGCSSFLGKTGGKQQLSLGNGCVVSHVIIHELLHALGFHHEQNRPDRDQYVRINLQNLADPQQAHNFDLVSSERAITFNLPYDLKSIMHYEPGAFAIPGTKTIEPLGNIRLTKNKRLSRLDIQAIQQLYRC